MVLFCRIVPQDIIKYCTLTDISDKNNRKQPEAWEAWFMHLCLKTLKNTYEYLRISSFLLRNIGKFVSKITTKTCG